MVVAFELLRVLLLALAGIFMAGVLAGMVMMLYAMYIGHSQVGQARAEVIKERVRGLWGFLNKVWWLALVVAVVVVLLAVLGG